MLRSVLIPLNYGRSLEDVPNWLSESTTIPKLHRIPRFSCFRRRYVLENILIAYDKSVRGFEYFAAMIVTTKEKNRAQLLSRLLISTMKEAPSDPTNLYLWYVDPQ